MSNTDPIRWQQRLQTFEQASALLFEAVKRPAGSFSELEQGGVVQCFEYSFELAWKTLKDLLFYEGFDLSTPRAVIRQAFKSEYLDAADTKALLDALERRNLLSHTYNKAKAAEALRLIRDDFAPVLKRLLARLVEERDRTA